MIVGQPQRGATPVNLASDVVRGISVTLAAPAYMSHLAVLLDGLGPGVGAALVRGVVFDSSGKVIARGDEVEIADGAPAAWVQLPMGAFAGILLTAGDYRFAMHVGGPTNCARAHVDNTGASASWQATDPYADGTANLTFGPGVAFLAGAASGAGGATATLRATTRLTASAPAAGAASGVLGVGSGAVPLTGSSTGAGTVSGTLAAGTSTYGAAFYGTSTYSNPVGGSQYGTANYGAGTYG